MNNNKKSCSYKIVNKGNVKLVLHKKEYQRFAIT